MSAHRLKVRQDPGFPGGNSTTSGPPSSPVFPSPNVTATGDWTDAVQKAQKFVAQLTLPEKVNLTTGIDIFGRCVGNTGTIPRLNFNGFCLEDSPLGVRFGDFASAFPAGINAAMTWDKDLIKARGVAMGQEHRGKGVNVQLGPMMNMGRNAAAGRNWEGFGADPFLTGVSSALTIEGIQSAGVIACAKHYVGNEQEHFRSGSGGGENSTSTSSDISDRTMHEIYAWPFGESVKAGVGSIMCSYQRINGTYACENSKTINGLAKEEWDFKGFMLSDWGAIEGGLQAAQGGVDMDMPGFIGYGIGDQNEQDPANANNSFWGHKLIEFVEDGSLPEWRITDMATRIMAAFFKMGQDQNYPPVNFDVTNTSTFDNNGNLVNEHVNVQGDHFKNIRAVGSASTILLKHQKGNLPLNKKKLPKSIAILGSDAGPNFDGPNACQNGNTDKGCSQGTLAMGWGSGTANFPYLIDPLSAIANWVHSQDPTVVIDYLLDDFNTAQASKLAAKSELCMVFANADSGEGYITVDGNAGDRNNITLWHGGEALINATMTQCNNTVVVLHTVGPVVMESWIENPNITDVLYAGLPGQESGNALLDVLIGAVNPSGRLPYTIAKDPNDYPAQVVYTNPTGEAIIHIPYTEELMIDYRHFDANNIKPRFEFGFGLSYTKFAYTGLSVKKASSFGKKKRSLDETPALPTSSRMQTVRVSSKPTGSASSAASSSVAASASSSASSAPTGAPSISMPSISLPTVLPSGSGSVSVPSMSIPGSSSSVPASSSLSFPTGPIVIPTGGIGGNTLIYDDALDITFKVRNTGSVDGAEVAQLYIGFPEDANEPPKVLRGFEKKMISKGATESFTISVRNKDLAIWDVVKQAWTIPAGQFTIFVGTSSRDIRLQQDFNNPKAITLKAS